MEKEDALLAKLIRQQHPELVERLRPLIQRPQATFRHLNRLRILRDLYCQHQKIPENILVGINRDCDRRKSSDHKEMFIAVIIKLYNPEILTGYDEKIMDGLCEELSDILQCNRVQVSDFASTIRVKLNPGKSLTAYSTFRQTVYDIVDFVRGQFKDGEVLQGGLFVQ